jgi:4-amino-4-deoxy-L-arabinose transferase-like glycosyltransferase
MRRSLTPALRVQVDSRLVVSSATWAVLIFLLALAPRLPGLSLFLTSDEPDGIYWAGSQFIEGLLSGNLALTYWHFYPGVVMSWAETLGLAGAWVLARLSGGTTETLAQFVRRPILELILAARLPYALLTAGSVAGFYLIARRLLGHWAALLGALFIAFDPFYLAHSRVAHGDAPATVFMGLSALAFFVYLQGTWPEREREEAGAGRGVRNRRAWLILSAVMGGLAALTKTPGQFMALFVVIVGVGDWVLRSWRARRLDGKLIGRWLVDLALWGGVAVFVFVALWPAMWVDPAGTLLRMIGESFGKVEEGHLVFFMGQSTLDPGPWFYPYVIPFRLTPITLVGALVSVPVIAGGLATLAHSKDDGGATPTFADSRYVAAGLLWIFVVSLLLFGNLSPKKQDRYLLPLFPMLDMLAAFAVVEIGKSANRQIGESANRRIGKLANQHHALRFTQYVLRSTPYAVLIALLLIHALPIATAYPYYLAYFNPLMGGLPRAVKTTLVGWGEGMEQVADYLNQRPDADDLYVAAVPSQTLLPYFRGDGENFYTNDVGLRADYVVLYISQVQRMAPSPDIVRYFQMQDPEHVVTVRGVPFAWIYRGPQLITADVPPQATLANIGVGDRLRLAGYQISDLQPTASSLDVTLVWHALAALDKDYTVSVRLVASDGERLAQHDGWPAGGLLPTSQWRPGDYVRDSHSLALPPRLEPGTYQVQVVVYHAETGAALSEPLAVSALTVEKGLP